MHWNLKVAKSRGKEWNKKLMAGKLEARINPTNLRLCRVKRGITQTTLADQLNLTYATYGAYENGKRAIKESVANEISSKLNVSFKKLFAPHEKLKSKFVARRGRGDK